MAFTCPRCAAVSHNPNDEREGYCGACHWWTGDPVLGRVAPPSEPPSDTGPVALVPHLSGEELEVLRIELDVALLRWGEVLARAQAPEIRAQVLRRVHLLHGLRTAFEEARAGLAHRSIVSR